MSLAVVLAAVSFCIWIGLLLGRGGFWHAAERDDPGPSIDPLQWPRVAAIVPARDEADVIAHSIGSLLDQNYPGGFEIILVDDQSRDGTAKVARDAAAARHAEDRLQIVSGSPLPAGWTGKLWAMQQGLDVANAAPSPPAYVLLTDADIAYAPDTLRSLVNRAEAERLVLVSLMAKLRCQSFAERALIPAFVFFFQMLFPFAFVNRKDHPLAAAAGGCMLVRRDALLQAGGVAMIKGALIDDCALGALLKRQGPIWLGLTERAQSLRPYETLSDVRRMVARSAYTQLRHSPLLLVGAMLGMALTYLAPPLLALFGEGFAQFAGMLTWALMAFAFQPMLRFYRVSPYWGLALPLIALTYMFFTIDSAYQHWRGRGGFWKGRVQATDAKS